MKKIFCGSCRDVADPNTPMLRCISCKSCYHVECVDPNNAARTNRESAFTCHECESRDNTYAPIKVDKKKLNSNKIWARKLLNERMRFLEEYQSDFNKFCSEDTMKSVLRKKDDFSQNIDEITPEQYDSIVNICETPSYIKNATLRDYQLEGVSNMSSWFARGVGGILADEMGLGKTIQTIAFIAGLKHKLGLSGPHLVVTPLSVLQNWANELVKFCPTLTFKKLYGSRSERDQIFSSEPVLKCEFDVYLTTYETLIGEEPFFTDSWPWVSITIDEGHRIKNENAKLRAALCRLKCPFRLLLTGTPLQNNLHELWTLMQYILPEVFKDAEYFDTGTNITSDMLNRDVCLSARKLLDTHMMVRRVKAEVEKTLLPKLHCKLYVPMTTLQRTWYNSIASKDDLCKSALTMNQMLHIFSQLRKVVNHPKQLLIKRERDREKERKMIEKLAYAGCEFSKPSNVKLAPEPGSKEYQVEEELRNLVGDSLIRSCGKLAVLDRLLIKLRNRGARCLIFSQFTETLDVIEEYVNYRFGKLNEVYYRLDGDTNRILREISTRSFNSPDATSFLYLISTAAGGVGINLATADTVILYDSCWNPQIDLQAQDRAHRIGQKKQVTVYRLITENSFEERVLQMAERKQMLDALVIAKQSAALEQQLENLNENESLSISELSEMLSYGGSHVSGSTFVDTFDDDMMHEVDDRLDAFITDPTGFKDNILSIQGRLCMKELTTSEASEKKDDDKKVNLSEIPPISEVVARNVDLSCSYCEISPILDRAYKCSVREDYILCAKCHSSFFYKGKFNLPYPTYEITCPPSVKRARKAPKRFDPPTFYKADPKQRKPRIHEDDCFMCNDGGLVMECRWCPKVYHMECLGLTTLPKENFTCPWHSCIECDRNMSDSGGMQFRCLDCCISYCFDCWPTDKEMVNYPPPRQFVQNFERRGFELSKNAMFFRCVECVKIKGEYVPEKVVPPAYIPPIAPRPVLALNMNIVNTAPIINNVLKLQPQTVVAADVNSYPLILLPQNPMKRSLEMFSGKTATSVIDLSENDDDLELVCVVRDSKP